MTTEKAKQKIRETKVILSDYRDGIVVDFVGRDRGLGRDKLVIRIHGPLKGTDPQGGVTWEWPEDVIRDTPENRNLIRVIQEKQSQADDLGRAIRKAKARLSHYHGTASFLVEESSLAE